MISVNIGGVPEYFNLPIHLAVEDGAFEKNNIKVNWVDVPEGTGAMSSYLADGTLDLAIILTEGITKSIIEGNPSKILRTYVSSPLIWGVHTQGDHPKSSIKDFENGTFAISRYGSGSNLMAVLLAQSMQWDVSKLKFEVVNHLQGAIDSFEKRHSDLFLWEKYTTQPYVDSGTFKRIYDYPTPWPCFVVAGNNDFVIKEQEAVQQILSIIFDYCNRLKKDTNAVPMIVERYELKKDRVIESFNALQYSNNEQLSEEIVLQIYQSLSQVGAVKKTLSSSGDLLVAW